MRHVLLKRRFVILGVGIMIMAAMIPIAAFAQAATPTRSAHHIVVVTQECIQLTSNPGRQVIGTFKKNDEVKGTAIMTSPTDSGEVYQEGLVLIESNGSFTKLILANSGTQHFEFKAPTNGDQLTACFANIGHDDDSDATPPVPPVSDHAGSINFEIDR